MSSAQPHEPRACFAFGPFVADPDQGQLFRDGEVVPLTPKVFETLLVLVENAGRVVTREALMTQIWPDTIVTDTSLTQNVWLLRKALREEEDGARYIDTIPRRGYRFIGEVHRVAPVPPNSR